LRCEINSISDEVKTTTLSSLKEKKSNEVMEKEVGAKSYNLFWEGNFLFETIILELLNITSIAHL
jgi:hypothetical protein